MPPGDVRAGNAVYGVVVVSYTVTKGEEECPTAKRVPSGDQSQQCPIPGGKEAGSAIFV